MATVQELSDELDTIGTKVDEALLLAQESKAEIARLTAIVAGGGAVTQEQLDGLDAKADGIIAKFAPVEPPVEG